jgi:predicted DNA-binding transcriptional regulator AlpA
MITSLAPDQTQLFGGKRFLKSGVVMELLGYQSRASFWDFVRRSGVPHVRLNARRILFEEQALLDWIRRRSVS